MKSPVPPPVRTVPAGAAVRGQAGPAAAVRSGDRVEAHGAPWRRLLAELVRFGTVGAVAFVVDVGLFNHLRFGPGEVLIEKPLTAKILSAAVATLVAWLGNRYWVFARHRTDSRLRELAAFALANVGGVLIAVGCLAFSHYVLDLTSPLADNVSANVIGLALGTAFRFAAYKWFVFTGRPAYPAV